MQFRTLSLSLAGFLCGAAIAWALTHREETRSPSASASASQTAAPAPPQPDAVTAWAALDSRGRGVSAHLAQADLISRATAADMPRLLALALAGDDPLTRELLLRRWVALDTAGLAAWLAPLTVAGEGLESETPGDAVVGYGVWAETDPAAAMAALKAGAPPGIGILYAGRILPRLMAVDMATGVKFGALMGSAMTLGQAFYNMGPSDWVQADPAKAAGLLSALPPSDFRERSLYALMGSLAKTDPAAAIALKKKFPETTFRTGSRSIIGDLYSSWAATDRAGMLDFLNNKAPMKERSAMKVALAHSIAQSDPQAALAWVDANLSGRDRISTTRGIMEALSKENPAAALTYLNSLAPGSALNAAAATFVESPPEGDPAAALTLADSLPPGAARDALTAKAYEISYAKAPDELLRRLAAQPADTLPPGIWGQLGSSTGSTAEGLTRVATLPPEAATAFVRGLFQARINWNSTLEDFTGAMTSLTEPALRKAAIESGLGQVLWRNPAAVTRWALTLPASDRSTVADQMENSFWNFTPTQKAEMIAPLRR